MNKAFVIITALLVIIVLYSLQLINSNGEARNPTSLASDAVSSKPEAGNAVMFQDQKLAPIVAPVQQPFISNDGLKDSSSDTRVNGALPFNIQLLGLVYSAIPAESYTQLNNEGHIAEYAIDDEIQNSDIYIKRINRASIVLEFESVDYELKLGIQNSLAEAQNLVRFAQMTAGQIGSRPRTIEHIVRLIPNLFNDGGKVVLPGQNPSLFNAARFKDGDVLLSVNGFNIDDESSFAELQKHVRTAQTLQFTVNRAGRQVTLYLDIPSEALKM